MLLELPVTPDQRRAWQAIHEARRRYPGPVADVLRQEILYSMPLLSRLGPQAQVKRLIQAILTPTDRSHRG
jgi:hypothetical protein